MTSLLSRMLDECTVTDVLFTEISFSSHQFMFFNRILNFSCERIIISADGGTFLFD